MFDYIYKIETLDEIKSKVYACYLHGTSTKNIAEYFNIREDYVHLIIEEKVFFDTRKRLYNFEKSCNVIGATAYAIHSIDARHAKKLCCVIPKTKKQIVAAIQEAKNNAYYISINK